MKLWEIKAQSLRLMFADSDMNFDEHDFTEGIVYNNSNTREKLVRMNDSINRGIDFYYRFVGEPFKKTDFTLTPEGFIDVSIEPLFGVPIKVGLTLYSSEDKQRMILQEDSINFNYDELGKRIFFNGNVFTNKPVFSVLYRIKKQNLPMAVSEMEFDLDTLYIPSEVQRMLPYFIKGELYEEDEPSMAYQAKMEFFNFLKNVRKPFAKTQTKVKKSNIFRKE